MNREQKRKLNSVVERLLKLEKQLHENPGDKNIQKEIENLILNNTSSFEDILYIDEVFTSKVDF